MQGIIEVSDYYVHVQLLHYLKDFRTICQGCARAVVGFMASIIAIELAKRIRMSQMSLKNLEVAEEFV